MKRIMVLILLAFAQGGIAIEDGGLIAKVECVAKEAYRPFTYTPRVVIGSKNSGAYAKRLAAELEASPGVRVTAKADLAGNEKYKEFLLTEKVDTLTDPNYALGEGCSSSATLTDYCTTGGSDTNCAKLCFFQYHCHRNN